MQREQKLPRTGGRGTPVRAPCRRYARPDRGRPGDHGATVTTRTLSERPDESVLTSVSSHGGPVLEPSAHPPMSTFHQVAGSARRAAALPAFALVLATPTVAVPTVPLTRRGHVVPRRRSATTRHSTTLLTSESTHAPPPSQRSSRPPRLRPARRSAARTIAKASAATAPRRAYYDLWDPIASASGLSSAAQQIAAWKEIGVVALAAYKHLLGRQPDVRRDAARRRRAEVGTARGSSSGGSSRSRPSASRASATGRRAPILQRRGGAARVRVGAAAVQQRFGDG